MKSLRILVVVHQSLVPPASLEGYTDQQIDEWRTEYDVIQNLRGLGHEVQCLGGFGKNKVQQKRTATAKDALRFLWDYLGWTGGARPVALGLFGKLHSGFRHYRKNAQRLCQQFDERYPDAAL